jgi:hypothetical protein
VTATTSTYTSNASGAGGTTGVSFTVPGSGSQTVLVTIGGVCHGDVSKDGGGCSMSFLITHNSGGTTDDAAASTHSWTLSDGGGAKGESQAGSSTIPLTLTGGTTYNITAEYANESAVSGNSGAGNGTYSSSYMIVAAY